MCRQTCHQKLLLVAIQNQDGDSSLLANPSVTPTVDHKKKWHGMWHAGFNSSMVMDTNWDGAIGDMGQHGWELVTILQTSATTTQTQFISVKISC
jgi:hypothetical protein